MRLRRQTGQQAFGLHPGLAQLFLQGLAAHQYLLALQAALVESAAPFLHPLIGNRGIPGRLRRAAGTGRQQKPQQD